MLVQYQSDGERTGIMPLAELIANFNESGGWQFRYNEQDMRDELASRGWYEGLHDHGHYLVLNLELLGLQAAS